MYDAPMQIQTSRKNIQCNQLITLNNQDIMRAARNSQDGTNSNTTKPNEIQAQDQVSKK